MTSGTIAPNFALLLRAICVLHVGSGDAVFCGLGAAASMRVERVWRNAPLQPMKSAMMGLLILGGIGLTLATPLAPAMHAGASPAGGTCATGCRVRRRHRGRGWGMPLHLIRQRGEAVAYLRLIACFGLGSGLLSMGPQSGMWIAVASAARIGIGAVCAWVVGSRRYGESARQLRL